MTHVRQQVIAATTAAVTGLTTTGAKVFPSRTAPLADADVPGLTVTDQDETVIQEQSPFGHLYRQLTIEINGHSANTTDAAVSVELNKIASEVEVAMAANVSLGGIALGSTLVSTEKALNDDADGVTGSIKLTYTVDYLTAVGAPDTPVT